MRIGTTYGTPLLPSSAVRAACKDDAMTDAMTDPRTGGESEVRTGGLAAWAPRITPPIGVDLTNEQALACAFRILAADGVSENIAGHITWADRDDGTMLVNPWGLWWEEITASDVCRVDADAAVVEGR